MCNFYLKCFPVSCIVNERLGQIMYVSVLVSSFLDSRIVQVLLITSDQREKSF